MLTSEFEEIAGTADRTVEGARLEFGQAVALSGEIGSALDTEPLKNWVR
ncbi:hypothetical protein [Streptomyces tsukubensis]|nr:hypothetical protein [Streptomyces tsukubensis]